MRTWIARYPGFLALLMAAVLLAGCASRSQEAANGNAQAADADNRNDLSRSGAHPVTFDAVETINLLYLLDPESETRREWGKHPSNPAWSRLALSEKYDLAFAHFGQMHAASQLRSRRDLVQNRLIMASERRCGRFVQYLKKDQSDMNFRFGVASTVLSGLGALVPGLRGAQNLSGASAMVNGVQATYNNEYFSNLAVSVIARGIEERRLDEINLIRSRQASAYGQYDIAAAVADAVRYDSLCNIVAGLEKANDAITRVAEPGQDAINRSLLRSHLTRALSSNNPQDFKAVLDGYKDMGINTTALVSSLVYAPRNQSPSDFLASSSATGGAADLASGMDPYAAAVKAEKQIRDGFDTVLPRLNGMLTDSGMGSATRTAIVATVTAEVTSAVGSFTASFSALKTGTQTNTVSCMGEADLLGKAVSEASREVQKAEADRLGRNGNADALRLKYDAFDRLRRDVGEFENRLFQYQQRIRAEIDAALAGIKPRLDAFKTDDFKLRWSTWLSEKIGPGMQCRYQP